MKNVLDAMFGRKVGKTRVVPLSRKIVLLFVFFLLLSNFVTNYLNLTIGRGELLKLMNTILQKELKEMYVFAGNQFDIYFYNQDLGGAVDSLETYAEGILANDKALCVGVRADGSFFFQAVRGDPAAAFSDEAALSRLRENLAQGTDEGVIEFLSGKDRYFGVYKYHPKWESWFVRAEEWDVFYGSSWKIFRETTLYIILITLFCTLVGVAVIAIILRFVRRITSGIIRMQENQEMDLLDLKGAPNDEITYLGMSMNALSNTIDNLLGIFKKFVAQDIAQKAYKERSVRLEGRPMELAILFSDIRGFTTITETLGNDVISLLNAHYNNAIKAIHKNGGIIGSIIGDALLAVYGAFEDSPENKSVQAVRSAYAIHAVAADVREKTLVLRDKYIHEKGTLTDDEERFFRAVLIDVGVGIDGGEVFYGTIGSTERMTTTVIGDRVNSSSRIEGLTRIYKVPVICSEYIRNEVEDESGDFIFIELDKVQVKGKTAGTRIFWPIEKSSIDADLEENLRVFSEGLDQYYGGDWNKAHRLFTRCTLPAAEVFADRTSREEAPADWNGIWKMMTK